LAGETSNPDIGRRDGCSGCDFFDIFEPRDTWPMLLQDRVAELIDLALDGDLKAGALET
jgi:hypothetical protein